MNALEFATRKHKGQTRKDGSAYVTHPIRVAATLKSLNCDQDLVDAGYLHDTIEDTNATYEEIQDAFNERVANLVLGVTSDDTLIKKMGKAEYLAMKMVMMDDDELTLKLSDRLDNVSDLHTANKKWANKYRKETFYILYMLTDNRFIRMNDVHKHLIKEIYVKLYS